jgi:catechol 2,3-dioxygenase-like lactoylglutathione lyase family enzyme
MLGRAHHVVIDCPDPQVLGRFYSELLGLPVTYGSDDFVVVARDDTSSGFAFQLVIRRPGWAPPIGSDR